MYLPVYPLTSGSGVADAGKFMYAKIIYRREILLYMNDYPLSLFDKPCISRKIENSECNTIYDYTDLTRKKLRFLQKITMFVNVEGILAA